jgi:hypothetical protein
MKTHLQLQLDAFWGGVIMAPIMKVGGGDESKKIF